jgi:hypothetical protein
LDGGGINCAKKHSIVANKNILVGKAARLNNLCDLCNYHLPLQLFNRKQIPNNQKTVDDIEEFFTRLRKPFYIVDLTENIPL